MHYIDDGFSLQQVNLGVVRVDGSHTAEKITELSNQLLINGGVDQKQVISVTHDSGILQMSTNVEHCTAAAQVKAAKSGAHAGTSIRCAAHILNLSVKRCLSNAKLEEKVSCVCQTS